MRREGLRAMAFSMLCVSFAVAFFTAMQPPAKSESRWFISEELGLDRLKDVTRPETLFKRILEVSAAARSLSPLSSEYVEDDLYKVKHIVDKYLLPHAPPASHLPPPPPPHIHTHTHTHTHTSDTHDIL